MDEKQNNRTRIHRIGTVTFGLALVVLGLVLLLRIVFPVLNYEMIFRMWPLIFISLGLEVLISSRKPEEQIRYDGAAIFLMVLLVFFAMGMAGMDWIFLHYPEQISCVRF